MFGSGYHKKSFEKQVEHIESDLGAALQTAQGIALRVRKNIREKGNEGIARRKGAAETAFTAWFDETNGTAFIASGKDRWGRWIKVGISYDDDERCVRIDQTQFNPVPRSSSVAEQALTIGEHTRCWLKEGKRQDTALVAYDEGLRQVRATAPKPGVPMSAAVADNLAESLAYFTDGGMQTTDLDGAVTIQQRESVENDVLWSNAE